VLGEEGGSSITALEGGDVQFAWYRDSVTAALYSHWRRPILSGLVEQVEARVTFDILRDGSVRGLRIDHSSGLQAFDRSALRAVSDAAPLPPLPGNWRDATLPATFVFKLFPE
jgi:TonB family protein